MKFCTSCGHKVAPSDRFCSNCGTELSHVTDNAGFIKPDLKVKNMLSDTKKAANKVRKLLLPTLSVFIVGVVALVAYNIIKDQEKEKIHAVLDQALQEQEAKERLIKLEECVLENFANAHGDSKKVWSYLKVMCSLRNTEVDKYQKEWGENLELLKKKRADEALIVH